MNKMNELVIGLENLVEFRRLCDKWGYDNPVLQDVYGGTLSKEAFGDAIVGGLKKFFAWIVMVWEKIVAFCKYLWDRITRKDDKEKLRAIYEMQKHRSEVMYWLKTVVPEGTSIKLPRWYTLTNNDFEKQFTELMLWVSSDVAQKEFPRIVQEFSNGEFDPVRTKEQVDALDRISVDLNARLGSTNANALNEGDFLSIATQLWQNKVELVEVPADRLIMIIDAYDNVVKGTDKLDACFGTVVRVTQHAYNRIRELVRKDLTHNDELFSKQVPKLLYQMTQIQNLIVYSRQKLDEIKTYGTDRLAEVAQKFQETK